MHQSTVDPIDTRQFEFLSYAAPTGGPRPGMEEIRVSVEPEIGAGAVGATAHIWPVFPLQPGKIQRPLLPEETLRRDRLLDRLSSRGNRRIVFVTAEAGFGKTTLIADFARRSRLRTFWYRLDDGDTDGLVFLRYLIASCQSIDPRLLRCAAARLSESPITSTTQGSVEDAVLADIASLGEVPSALVLDDFHLVEEVASIREVVDRLIARAPRGLTIFVASRRTPRLTVACLRARGELAELTREELRFNESETSRLFSESYKHPLESDVVHDLQARTEGWAASLQLVKTAVEGRSPREVRAFIHSLTGAEGDLYDYLAEEVVGELPADLRGFLMRVTLLEEIDPESASIAADVPPAQARRLITDAQRLGLLSTGVGTVGSWRAHPLVGEFLLSHLQAEFGEGGIAELHRGLARLLEPRSWRLAARHWAAAEEADEVRRVICAAVPAIIGTGDFAATEDLISRFPDPNPNPWYDIIRSRQLVAAGNHTDALALALRTSHTIGSVPSVDPSLLVADALNVHCLAFQGRDKDLQQTAAQTLIDCGDPELSSIAKAAELLIGASEGGSLDDLVAELADTARWNRLANHSRHEAISLLNLALAEVARGNHAIAARSGVAALQLLGPTGSSGDTAAAHANTAKGLAHMAGLSQWESHAKAILNCDTSLVEAETVAEVAELHAMYGDPITGLAVMKKLAAKDPRQADSPYCRQVEARLEMLGANPQRAVELLSSCGPYSLSPGFRSSILALDLQLRAMLNPDDSSLRDRLVDSLSFAVSQQAWFWANTMRLTQALVAPTEGLVDHLGSLGPSDFAYLSIQAELITRRLGDLDTTSLEVVRQEAELRPERWRWALRDLLTRPSVNPISVRRAASLLDVVGDTSDVSLLRGVARRKSLRVPDAGRTLLRRLAPPAFVDDLGRIQIRVGEREIQGTEIRRKVLSLLGYLLTRPQFTASREQVVEALWPEMDPEPGANSLNQTAYFLRRMFEPNGEDDTTAGYLCSRADLMWLDPGLVQSRSSETLGLIAIARRNPCPDVIAKLSETYSGRFALDFLYEDWATQFRETLHASYLDRIERALQLDTRSGMFDRALLLAQQALQADPDADQIELCLLKLYRLTGAHAAAAEQYLHYASVVREQLGVEPPPLESL